MPAKDTLWVEHASDAGNDVGADVPIQSLDAAIADFREASFSSGPYSSMLMILCQACDGWKYRLILVDLVPASNIPVDRVWVQLDLTSKARPLQASRSRDGLTELRSSFQHENPNVGAQIITNTILVVPYCSYSIVYPKHPQALFKLLRPLY